MANVQYTVIKPLQNTPPLIFLILPRGKVSLVNGVVFVNKPMKTLSSALSQQRADTRGFYQASLWQ